MHGKEKKTFTTNNGKETSKVIVTQKEGGGKLS